MNNIIFSITIKDVEMVLDRKLYNYEIDTFKRKFALEGWADEVADFAHFNNIDDSETLKEKFKNEQQRADELADKNESLIKEVNGLQDKITDLEEFEERCAYAEERLRELGLMEPEENDGEEE